MTRSGLRPLLTERPFAHRGAWCLNEGRPENSPAAFLEAVRMGHGIELDVQLTLDRRAAVFHDATLERLTDAEGRVADRTAAELAQMTLKSGADAIPLLEDVLHLIGPETPVLVEIKHQEKSGPLEAAVAKALASAPNRAAIMSFNPVSIGWFRRNAPLVPRGLVFSCHYGMPGRGGWSRSPRAHRLAFRFSGAQFGASDIRDLPTSFTALLRKRRIPLLTWTVRTREDRERAAEHADNIIAERLDAGL